MPTVLEYNTVTISGCSGTTVEQEPVFDDSGTDLLFMKFTIRTTGYVHSVDTITDFTPSPTLEVPNPTTRHGDPSSPWTGPIPSPHSIGDPYPFRGGAAETEKYLRHSLLEPRKDFKLTVGKSFTGSDPVNPAVWIEAKPVNESSRAVTDDLNNGPKPLSLKVTKITGNNIFKIDFAIEVCILECSNSASSLSMVLSNRWSVTDDFNENQGCTRVIQGQLRIATANVNANNFRGMVTPRLAPGFKRERTNFEVTSDGLKLNYSFTDKEVHYSAPAPATWMSIQHREHSGSGQNAIGECTVSLSGPRDASHAELLKIAAIIVQTKLGRRVVGNGFLKHLTMAVYVDTNQEPRVEVHAVAEHISNMVELIANGQLAADNALKQIMDQVGTHLVKPISAADLPNYDSRVSVQPGISGKLPITGAFSTYLQSPCYDSHQFIDAKNPAETSDVLDSDFAGQVTEAIVPDDSYLSSPAHTLAHQSAIYTYAQIEGRRRTTGGKVHLPISKRKESGSSSSQSDYPDSVVATVGPQLSKLYISIVFERAGNYPQLPYAADFIDGNGILHTLLDSDILDRSQRVMADGTQIFYTQAEFTFAMARGLRPGENRILPSLPWLYTPVQTQYPSDTYPPLIG